MQLLTRSLVAFVLLSLLANAVPARAAVEAPDQQDGVDPFFGSFGNEVPIQVPSYHGLEPQLNLQYNSSGRDSWLGFGWTLGGISMIQRASPNKGLPGFNANDISLLDGTELIPCTVLGGTHCTRVQSFTRIEYEPGGDRWRVTGTGGSSATYEPLFQVNGITFRWYVTRIEDLHGNHTDYEYDCTGLDCYPRRIAYNGSEIEFIRSPRPDPVPFATGISLGSTNDLLRAIDVRVGGQRVRAYQLSYTQSSSTRRSMLSSVQQFGRDAAIDAAGNVSGPTSLPPQSHSYSETVDGLADFSHWSGHGLNTDFWRTQYADVTGDGRADLVYHGGDNSFAVSVSTGTAMLTPATWGGRSEPAQPGQIQLADATGDGKADLVFQTPTNEFLVYVSTGAGFSFAGQWMNHGAPFRSGQTSYADVNGDGKADLIHFGDDGIFWVSVSTGSSFKQPAEAWMGHGSPFQVWQAQFADVNGDGQVDLIYQGNFNQFHVSISTGADFIDGDVWHSGFGGSPQNGQAAFSDVNGDGAADLLYHGNDGLIRVALSQGNRFVDQGAWEHVDAFNPGLPGQMVWRDMNNDGRSDLVFQKTVVNSSEFWVSLSTGHSLVRQSAPWEGHGSPFTPGQAQFADVSGDGKPDLIWQGFNFSNSTTHFAVSPSLGATPDLLVSVDNGAGGRKDIDYANYARSGNSAEEYLPLGLAIPAVAAITTHDGRGASERTEYDHTGARWSDSERRFLGFRKVTTTFDGTSAYTETYYLQEEGTASKPEETYFRNPDGSILTYSMMGYTNNGAEPPFVSHLTDRWDYECEGASAVETCRKSRTQFSYDEYGNVLTTYEYGDVADPTDDRTRQRSYFANTVDYLVGFPATETLRFGIDENGEILEHRQLLYDDLGTYTAPPQLGLVTKKRRWNSLTGGYEESTYGYDPYGNLVRETDEAGRSVQRIFDFVYRVYPTAEWNDLGHVTQRTFDFVIGQVTSESDANGVVATSEYDALGRRVRSVHETGSELRWEYLDLGDPNQQRIREIREDGSPEGLWAESFRDGLGRVYRERRKGGLVRDFEYLLTTQLTTAASDWYEEGNKPNYERFVYDSARRRRRAVHPDLAYAEISYGIGFQIHRDELGHEQITWRDVFGRVTRIQEDDGTNNHDTYYEYDGLDRLVRVQDAQGNETTVAWDSLGRRSEICEPDSGCSSFTYHPGDQLASRVDARGAGVSFSYDEIGRVAQKITSEGETTTWHYDEPDHGYSIGRPTRVDYPDGSESYSYDARGLPLAENRCVAGLGCLTLGREYDTMGRLDLLHYPDGEQVAYSYDTTGRLASVSGYVDQLEWSPDNRLVAITAANGVRSTFDYDGARRWLDSAEIRGPGGELLYDASYVYDLKARIEASSSSTDERLNLDFDYDPLDRLLNVSGHADQDRIYAYDAVGNMTYSSLLGSYEYEAGPVHGVSRAGDRRIQYDASGNIEEVWKPRPGPGCGGNREILAWYTWNAEGRLTEAVKAGVLARFAYDPRGDRIRKTIGSKTVGFYSNWAERVEEGQQSTLSQYYYAGSVMVARKEAGETYWYHADRLGSPKLLTDDTGQVVSHFDYDAYGREIQREGDVEHRRGFTGHRDDAELGLVYMRARYYDPLLGRFLSPDPIVPDLENPQSLNRYAYALNNPISNVDPTGNFSIGKAIKKAFKAIGKGLKTFAAIIAKSPYVSYLIIGLQVVGVFFTPAFVIAMSLSALRMTLNAYYNVRESQPELPKFAQGNGGLAFASQSGGQGSGSIGDLIAVFIASAGATLAEWVNREKAEVSSSESVQLARFNPPRGNRWWRIRRPKPPRFDPNPPPIPKPLGASSSPGLSSSPRGAFAEALDTIASGTINYFGSNSRIFAQIKAKFSREYYRVVNGDYGPDGAWLISVADRVGENLDYGVFLEAGSADVLVYPGRGPYSVISGPHTVEIGAIYVPAR